MGNVTCKSIMWSDWALRSFFHQKTLLLKQPLMLTGCFWVLTTSWMKSSDNSTNKPSHGVFLSPAPVWAREIQTMPRINHMVASLQLKWEHHLHFLCEGEIIALESHTCQETQAFRQYGETLRAWGRQGPRTRVKPRLLRTQCLCFSEYEWEISCCQHVWVC